MDGLDVQIKIYTNQTKMFFVKMPIIYCISKVFKIFKRLDIFPENSMKNVKFPEISLRFPGLKNSLRFPGFPGFPGW